MFIRSLIDVNIGIDLLLENFLDRIIKQICILIIQTVVCKLRDDLIKLFNKINKLIRVAFEFEP